MATEFSRAFFEENRIVKADLRAAHQLREEDWLYWRTALPNVLEFVSGAFRRDQ